MKTDLKNINELSPFFHHEEVRFSTEEKMNLFLNSVSSIDYEIEISRYEKRANRKYTQFIYLLINLK